MKSKSASALSSAELVKRLGEAEGVKLVVAFASPVIPLPEVNQTLQGAFPDAVILTASSAGEFTEQSSSSQTVCGIAIRGDFRVSAGIGIGLAEDPERACNSALQGQPTSVHGYPHRTALLLLDPLAGNGEMTTLLASQLLGPDVRVAGGTAGDDLAMKATFVGCGKTVSSNAITIATIFSTKPVGLAVQHGHEPLSEPLTITSATANVVHEIDGEPAWDVWRKHTREHAKACGVDVDALSTEEIPSYLLRFEAGLRSGQRIKVRAPMMLGQDGSLVFASEVPTGSVIRITESTPERQIESARIAARKARAQVAGEVSGAIVFDCICRALILGDQLGDAVGAMHKELGAPLIGFETYGEIALDRGDMSGFHNTTTVVLALPR